MEATAERGGKQCGARMQQPQILCTNNEPRNRMRPLDYGRMPASELTTELHSLGCRHGERHWNLGTDRGAVINSSLVNCYGSWGLQSPAGCGRTWANTPLHWLVMHHQTWRVALAVFSLVGTAIVQKSHNPLHRSGQWLLEVYFLGVGECCAVMHGCAKLLP